MRATVVASLLVLSSATTVAAEQLVRRSPPRIRIGTPSAGRIDNVTIQFRADPGQLRATVSMVLSSPAQDVRSAPELVIPIDVTKEIEVAKLSFARGAAEPAIAQPGAHLAMLETYRQTVDRQRDPALLERVAATSGGAAKLKLHVYPVVRGEPATVSFELILPKVDRFVIDAGSGRGQVATNVDGHWVDLGRLATPRAISLHDVTTSDLYEATEAIRVDAKTSLLAIPTASTSSLDESIARGMFYGDPDTDLPITNYIDLEAAITEHAAAIAHCYEFGHQRDEHLPSRVTLATTIDRHGRVIESRLDGMPNSVVGECITEYVDQWHFFGFGDTETLHYAFDLAALPAG